MFCSHVDFQMNRREFFGRFGLGLGGAALAQLLNASAPAAPNPFQGILAQPHFAPKARRIIYLFMASVPRWR